MSRIFHCDTVPHALPRFHNPFSSLLVQFEKATGQPPTYFLWKMTHNMNSIKFSEAHLLGKFLTFDGLDGLWQELFKEVLNSMIIYSQLSYRSVSKKNWWLSGNFAVLNFETSPCWSMFWHRSRRWTFPTQRFLWFSWRAIQKLYGDCVDDAVSQPQSNGDVEIRKTQSGCFVCSLTRFYTYDRYIAEISWEMIRIHSYIPSKALGKLFFQLSGRTWARGSPLFSSTCHCFQPSMMLGNRETCRSDGVQREI